MNRDPMVVAAGRAPRAGVNPAKSFLLTDLYPLTMLPCYWRQRRRYQNSSSQAHDDEASAFLRFAEANPGNVTLVIDAYDTEAGTGKVVRLAPALQHRGVPISRGALR